MAPDRLVWVRGVMPAKVTLSVPWHGVRRLQAVRRHMAGWLCAIAQTLHAAQRAGPGLHVFAPLYMSPLDTGVPGTHDAFGRGVPNGTSGLVWPCVEGDLHQPTSSRDSDSSSRSWVKRPDDAPILRRGGLQHSRRCTRGLCLLAVTIAAIAALSPQVVSAAAASPTALPAATPSASPTATSSPTPPVASPTTTAASKALAANNAGRPEPIHSGQWLGGHRGRTSATDVPHCRDAGRRLK